MDLLNKTIHPYFGTKEFQIGKNMSSLIDILHDTSNDEKEIKNTISVKRSVDVKFTDLFYFEVFCNFLLLF